MNNKERAEVRELLLQQCELWGIASAHLNKIDDANSQVHFMDLHDPVAKIETILTILDAERPSAECPIQAKHEPDVAFESRLEYWREHRAEQPSIKMTPGEWDNPLVNEIMERYCDDRGWCDELQCEIWAIIRKYQQPSAAGVDWHGRCLTCRYWTGVRAELWGMIEDKGDIVMDDKDGWPTSANCCINFEYQDATIDGDASVAIEVYGNHGCRRWAALTQTGACDG